MRINRVALAASMARLDLNSNQVAEQAGISRSTMTAVKSGKSCSQNTADKLVAVLGKSIITKEARA